MNNLHRDLAPISAAAWAEIEEEARRTFSTRIAGRKVLDMPEPAGIELSAIGIGHIEPIAPPLDGVQAHKRQVQSVVELRVPFSVSRSAVDDVERGAQDSDWQPVKDAAEKLAAAEDRLVFYGSEAAGVVGIVPSSSNATIPLPADDPVELPTALAKALTTLRTVGVQGDYTLLLSADLYTAAAETTHHGYPVYRHLERILGDGQIVFAPAIDGAIVITTRGGDFSLYLGQDTSIGYLSHDAEQVQLYLQESLTFRVNTSEASVVIS